MATADQLSTDLVAWAPGTRHYRCSDGRYLAVEATEVPDQVETVVVSQGDSPQGDDLLVMLGVTRAALNLVVRPTVIFLSDEHGQPVDADENDHDPLTPLHVFPAGTTHNEALTQAGYEVTNG